MFSRRDENRPDVTSRCHARMPRVYDTLEASSNWRHRSHYSVATLGGRWCSCDILLCKMKRLGTGIDATTE